MTETGRQVEITPEMIEDGVNACFGEGGSSMDHADNNDMARIFTAVFCAMLSASGRTLGPVE